MLCAFDFDGTLADSKSAYYIAVKCYAEEHSLPLPPQEQMDLAFGHPTPPLFKGWGTLEDFRQHLDQIYLKVDDVLCEDPLCMPLYEGVPDLLQGLKKDNIALAIVTSRNLKPLLSVLKAHHIDDFFKSIRSAQDMLEKGYRGKPYPDKLNCVLREFHCAPDQAIMVGDTLMDMKMAKNAGVFALGVSWGYHTPETLRKNGADGVAFFVEEIREVTRKKWPVK